jgi:hypothetical protein
VFEHDGGETMGSREEFFAHLSQRLPDDIYLNIRNHFDEHVAKDNVEQAYQCLCLAMVHVMDGLNNMSNQLLYVITGDMHLLHNDEEKPPP